MRYQSPLCEAASEAPEWSFSIGCRIRLRAPRLPPAQTWRIGVVAPRLSPISTCTLSFPCLLSPGESKCLHLVYPRWAPRVSTCILCSLTSSIPLDLVYPPFGPAWPSSIPLMDLLFSPLFRCRRVSPLQSVVLVYPLLLFSPWSSLHLLFGPWSSCILSMSNAWGFKHVLKAGGSNWSARVELTHPFEWGGIKLALKEVDR